MERKREYVVHPGQMVVTSSGKVSPVAFDRGGQVFVHGVNGVPEVAEVCGDAWGGECDQTMGLML